MKWSLLGRLLALLPAVGCADESSSSDTAGRTGLLGECTGFTATKERIVGVSGGSATTCAAWSDGTAWCWGASGVGELGYPGGLSVDSPGQVGVPPCVNGVSAGGLHGCAWMRDGTAYCWGDNLFGALGNPDAGGPTPARVVGLGTAMEVMARSDDSGALLVDGTVMQWGHEAASGKHALVPVKIDVAPATAFAVGNGHACAVVAGEVWCWGRNWAGELGFMVSGSPLDQYPPAVVVGVTGAIGVAVGYEFSCALLGNGQVWCWGRNDLGQLGNGSQTDSSVPVQVTGVATGIEVFAIDERACSLMSDGSVSCWGDFVDDPLQPIPAQIAGVHNVTHVALGDSHTCVVEGDASMLCWGINTYGQLGLGEAAAMFVAAPTPVVWPFEE